MAGRVIKFATKGFLGHLNGSSEKGFTMRARGRCRNTRLSWLAIAKKGNQPTRRLKSFAAIIVSTQTLYAHFELYGKAVHTMHPLGMMA